MKRFTGTFCWAQTSYFWRVVSNIYTEIFDKKNINSLFTWMKHVTITQINLSSHNFSTKTLVKSIFNTAFIISIFSSLYRKKKSIINAIHKIWSDKIHKHNFFLNYNKMSEQHYHFYHFLVQNKNRFIPKSWFFYIVLSTNFVAFI